MTFLAPLFLAALIAVLLPVIIHLINFRRPRKVAFSTLTFFKELQQTTMRRLKLKRWLLLLLRATAIILLALALARPYLPGGTGLTGGAPVLYGLLIENGIGMNRVETDGPLMDQAKAIASGIIDNARDQDRFLVYNTHGELFRGGILTANQARNALDEIDAGMYGSQLENRYRALNAAMDDWGGGARTLYWLGTGGAATVQVIGDMGESSVANAIPVNKILLGQERISNAVVRSVRAVSAISGPGVPFEMEVVVENMGRQDVFNYFVSMEAGGRLVGQYQSDLEAGASQTFIFEVIPPAAGDFTGRILLEGDGFSADNTRYFSVNIPQSRTVLLVMDETNRERTSYVQSVLRAGERLRAQLVVETITLNQLATRSDLTDIHAIILDEPLQIPDGLQEQLQRFVQAGNGLVFYPSERGSIDSYNRFLSRFNAGEIAGIVGEYGSFRAVTRLGRVSQGHPVVDNIFQVAENEEIRFSLPPLYHYLRYRSGGSDSGLTVLRSELGDPLLIEQRFGNGRVMINLLGASPGWSAMPGSPLFAPLAYRTALYAASVPTGSMFGHTLGQGLETELPMQGPSVEIGFDDMKFLPDTRVTGAGFLRLTYPSVEWTPGVYRITDGTAIRHLAVNLDILESDFRTLPLRDLENLLINHVNSSSVFAADEQGLEQLQSRIEAAGFGSEMWNWFILLAFIVLLAETVLSRWYKAETIT
jgi:hypothetical protein